MMRKIRYRVRCWIKKPRQAGQAIVFLLLALTALVFVMLFNYDLHRIIQRKNQAQNAGDAAALAAARWQGATINLVGELNLLHALALMNEQEDAVDAITNMQARLCFTGPLTALFAAQVAAKQNHIYVDENMTTLLREHANVIRTQYTATFEGEQYFKEPWPGAWDEYADMLDQVTLDGIAAGPDNAQFYMDPSSGHRLLEKAFYQAVLGRTWCWFHLHANGLIQSYNHYRDWPPIPIDDESDYANAEIFGVGMRPFTTRVEHFFTPTALEVYFREAGHEGVSADELSSTNVMRSVETWYLYNPRDWGYWERIRRDEGFPITGEVRPEYDVTGGDVVVRVYASASRMTPGIDGQTRDDNVLWSAAAKPFGYLDGDFQRERVTTAGHFVLPAFRDVRLIPVDAATGSENNSADFEWVRHVRSHLHPYLEQGPQEHRCRYCEALRIWEHREFRQEGIDWLELYSYLCIETTGGGGGGGGTRRGH